MSNRSTTSNGRAPSKSLKGGILSVFTRKGSEAHKKKVRLSLSQKSGRGGPGQKRQRQPAMGITKNGRMEEDGVKKRGSNISTSWALGANPLPPTKEDGPRKAASALALKGKVASLRLKDGETRFSQGDQGIKKNKTTAAHETRLPARRSSLRSIRRRKGEA